MDFQRSVGMPLPKLNLKKVGIMTGQKPLMLALGLAMFAAGCAKQPDQIAAIDVGDSGYAGMSCKQLSAEETKINQALENLSSEQKAAASGDAWGVFLLGLPLSSMSGNDKEAAIAVAKGQLQAIDRQQERKRCS